MGGEGRGWETQTVRGQGQRSPAPQALWRSCQSNSPQGHQKGQPNKDGRQCVWSSFIYRTSSKGKEHWLSVNQPACDCVCWFSLNNWYSCSMLGVYIWLTLTFVQYTRCSVNGVTYALCISGIQILSVGKFHCLLYRYTCIKLIDSYIQSDLF